MHILSLLKWPLVATALFVAVGYWNATRDPLVVRADIAIEGLPAGMRLRVVQVTDTHRSSADMPEARVARIVALANAQKPDLIVLTGDYHGGKLFDWPRTRLESAIQPLAALKAPLGVYAVLGNHDEPYWTPRVFGLHPSLNLLINRNVDIGPLVLVGVNSRPGPHDVAAAYAGATPGKTTLLLAHEPEALLHHRPPRADLTLSGHTHGGQIVLPVIGSLGALFLGAPACARGLCSLPHGRIFVSSGLGTSWVPLRFGVPPEIAVLTLYSTGRKSGTER
jgi:predicted MPP superfamily phosphohydrolase